MNTQESTALSSINNFRFGQLADGGSQFTVLHYPIDHPHVISLDDFRSSSHAL